MANNPKAKDNLVNFKKGKDPRRNTHGRPKSFDVLRKLAQRVAGQDFGVMEGNTVSRIEAMLLSMSTSKNPADRRLFLEYAFGKVTDKTENTHKFDLSLLPTQYLHRIAAGEDAQKVIAEWMGANG